MLPCPDGFNLRVWEFASKTATESKSHSESVALEENWESNCSDMIRAEVHHNIVSTIEELTKEWYEFAKMMANHKDPYWVSLFSDKPLN